MEAIYNPHMSNVAKLRAELGKMELGSDVLISATKERGTVRITKELNHRFSLFSHLKNYLLILRYFA
jgi:hypothetical protein